MFGFDIFVDWGIKVESFAQFGICMLYSDMQEIAGWVFFYVEKFEKLFGNSWCSFCLLI